MRAKKQLLAPCSDLLVRRPQYLKLEVISCRLFLYQSPVEFDDDDAEPRGGLGALEHRTRPTTWLTTPPPLRRGHLFLASGKWGTANRSRRCFRFSSWTCRSSRSSSPSLHGVERASAVPALLSQRTSRAPSPVLSPRACDPPSSASCSATRSDRAERFLRPPSRADLHTRRTVAPCALRPAADGADIDPPFPAFAVRRQLRTRPMPPIAGRHQPPVAPLALPYSSVRAM